MSVREQLDWEARWAKPVAAAAFVSVGFNVAASLYVSASIDTTPDADNTRELLRTVDSQSDVFVTGAVLSGIGTLLLAVVLWYLFNASRARRPELQKTALILAVAGPILLAGMTPTEAIVPTVISIVIGAAFGFVSEKLADALTKKEPAA